MFVATIVARYAFDGPVPLFWFDASTPGSGKGLLEQVGTHIATGDVAGNATWPRESAEQRKVITSIAIEAKRVVRFDEMKAGAYMGGPALNSVLTSVRWTDRILGTNDMFDGDFVTVLAALGNNARLADDMYRRVVHIRLAAKQERPEERDPRTFRHQDVMRYTRDNQPRLLAAVLTILRGYVTHGRPPVEAIPLDYAAWSRTVREPFIWAGVPDPALALPAMRAASGKEQHYALLVKSLVGIDVEMRAQTQRKKPRFRTMDVYDWVFAPSLISLSTFAHDSEDCKTFRFAFGSLGTARDRPTAVQQLGQRLSALAGRTFSIAPNESDKDSIGNFVPPSPPPTRRYRLNREPILDGHATWSVEVFE